MNVNAANLSEADIRDISGYFASKEFPKRAQNLEPAKIAAGEKIVTDMNCASCHGPTFRGAGMKRSVMAVEIFRREWRF
jgi:cytochrome c553